MIHLMEYWKDGIEYGKLDGLLDGMSLGQEDGTVLVSEVIVVDGEVNMSNLELMTWVCSLAPIKYR